MPMSEFLFNEFDAVSAKQWKQKIQYDLKGADYNETLVWKSPEGIHIKPTYHQDDFEHGFQSIPNRPNEWKIVQEIFIDDEEIANRLALDALNRGAEAIYFIGKRKFDIQKLLHELPFEKATFYFEFSFLSENFQNEVNDFLCKKNAEVYYLIDVVGNFARTGNWFYDREKDLEIFKNLNSKIENSVAVDLSLYQNSGAHVIQQLAYALAHANEYFTVLSKEERKNVSFTFKFSVGSNYFFEIAKIRAFRKLFQLLSKEYGFGTCHILSFPSLRNKTIYDYNVNLLRTTTECMSAVLGGADAVCNVAYDRLYHKSNEFGERVSRNQLLILKEESYFDVVENPVDGTYYIESLTEEFAQKALLIFKDIEKGGGFLQQLYEGVIQKKVKESAREEQERFDTETLKLLGTNYHINPNDRMKHDLELYPFLKKVNQKTVIEPIIEKRLAEESEQKRLETE